MKGFKLEYSYKIKESDKFANVKDVLKSYFLVSSRLLTKLKNSNFIYLNKKNASLSDAVEKGDIVSFFVDFDEDSSNILPVKMDLDIVFEDGSFLIVNKPPFMAVHPTAYHFSDTLSNGVKFYFDSINLHKKIRIVNRLDRNTSGLVIFAKNEYAQEFLSRQMKSFKINDIEGNDLFQNNLNADIKNRFEKRYLGIVQGSFKDLSDISQRNLNGIVNLHFSKIDNANVFIKSLCCEKNVLTGTIDLPIARKDGSIIERCVSPDGERAITHFRVLKEFNGCSINNENVGILKDCNYADIGDEDGTKINKFSSDTTQSQNIHISLVEFSLETGRTHQIRVHSSSCGHPLLGDDLYGGDRALINRQALHCYYLGFIHPETREFVSFTAPLPEDFKNVLKKLPNYS